MEFVCCLRSVSGIPPPSFLPGCFCVTRSDSWKSNDLASALPQRRNSGTGILCLPLVLGQGFPAPPGSARAVGLLLSPRLTPVPPNPRQGWGGLHPARLMKILGSFLSCCWNASGCCKYILWYWFVTNIKVNTICVVLK